MQGERGFVLIAALTLAILYFALMELLLVDSSRELGEARRFRARVVAAVLAENAAELAAVQMVSSRGGTIPPEQGTQGVMSAELKRGAGSFQITAEGTTSGVSKQTARVYIQGRIDASGDVKIDYTMHGQ